MDGNLHFSLFCSQKQKCKSDFFNFLHVPSFYHPFAVLQFYTFFILMLKVSFFWVGVTKSIVNTPPVIISCHQFFHFPFFINFPFKDKNHIFWHNCESLVVRWKENAHKRKKWKEKREELVAVMSFLKESILNFFGLLCKLISKKKKDEKDDEKNIYM